MARHHSGFFRAEPHDSVRLFLSADRATNGLVLDEIVDHHLTYFSTGFVIRFRRGHPRRDAIHPYTAVRVGDSSELGQADDARLRRRIGRRSEEHTSELQSLMRISSAVFCLP